MYRSPDKMTKRVQIVYIPSMFTKTSKEKT